MPQDRLNHAVMIGTYASVNTVKLQLAGRKIRGELHRIKGGRAILRVAHGDAQDALGFLCSQPLYDDCIISAEEANVFNCPKCREPVDPTMRQCAQCLTDLAG